MKIKEGMFLLIALFAFGNLFSQSNEEAEEKPNTINSQFVDVVENSNSYQQYKVIEIRKIQDLKSNVLDTLNSLYEEISGNEKEIDEQKSEIGSLNAEIGSLNKELNSTIKEKDSILFMGMLIEKSLFKTIFWSTVALLLLALLFFIYKYYNSQKVTVESKRELMEAHNELEEQRRRHIKKEQQIMRQLQDEINKNNR